jgi:hypothetical protein
MKTKLILAILLICMAGLLFGSADPAEMDEMQRRTQELKALSERFKADKGFEGVIETNSEVMKLSHFRGNFKDIDMSGVSDTLAFRQVCNRIINKLLPYIGAKENQLDAGKISISSTSIRTQYQQRVNGYPIEGAGRLVVSYEKGYNRLSILNVTVKVENELPPIHVNQETAIGIAREAYEKTQYCNELTPNWRHRSAIVYKARVVEGATHQYNLYWRITFPSVNYYIDVSTAEWFDERYIINDVYTYKIEGSTYNVTPGFADNGIQPMIGIEVYNGGIPFYTNSEGECTFPSLPDDEYQVNLRSEKFRLRSSPYGNTLATGNYIHDGEFHISTLLLDCMPIGEYYSYYVPNIYHHIYEQDQLFQDLSSDFGIVPYPMVVNDCQEIGTLGAFDPYIFEIQLRNGRNSHAIRHEVSHFFTYNLVGNRLFFDTISSDNAKLYQGMDESFAEYWLSIGINSTVHDYVNARIPP